MGCGGESKNLTLADLLFSPSRPALFTQVTSILLDIGLCALTLGRMEEAEVLYKRALAIESEHLGADHPDAQATARALRLFAPSD